MKKDGFYLNLNFKSAMLCLKNVSANDLFCESAWCYQLISLLTPDWSHLSSNEFG